MKKKEERKKEESRDQNSPKAFGELKRHKSQCWMTLPLYKYLFIHKNFSEDWRDSDWRFCALT